MSDVLATTIRTMDIMDDRGHTTFGWDASDDAWVLPMIRQKMAQGYTFWIVRRDPLREVRLERLDDVREMRHVIIRDPVARELFEQGHIGLVTTDNDTVTDDADRVTMRRARTAEDAVSNDTVAHRGLRGG
jgi:transposase